MAIQSGQYEAEVISPQPKQALDTIKCNSFASTFNIEPLPQPRGVSSQVSDADLLGTVKNGLLNTHNLMYVSPETSPVVSPLHESLSDVNDPYDGYAGVSLKHKHR